MKKIILNCIIYIIFGISILTATATVLPFKNAITNKIDLKGKEIAHEIATLNNISFVESDLSLISIELQLKTLFDNNYFPQFKTADLVITGEYYYDNVHWTIVVKFINVATRQVVTRVFKNTSFQSTINNIKSFLQKDISYKDKAKQLLNTAKTYDTIMESLRLLLISLEKEGNDWETYFLLGEIYQYLRDYSKSMMMYEYALQYTENIQQQFHILISIGILYKNMEQYNLAIETYNKALKIAQTNNQRAEVYLNMANIYVLNEQLDLANEVWNKALKLNPSKEIVDIIKHNRKLMENFKLKKE